MANKLNITADALRSILTYDPATGDFFWNDRPATEFKNDRLYKSWRARFSGKPAGTTDPHDYGRINIGGRVYFKHQLAWLYIYGEPADDEIDHIDQNRSNNRIENLRLASRSQNASNAGMRKHNKLGVKGVCMDMGFYRAQVKVGGKLVYSKRFLTIQEAKEAYDAEIKKHHKEFARTD
jgi:hypothetical protein